ncbi:MAG: helix-turn-helix transcriptional regulator [Rhodospirillaceae bacterium]
MKKSVYSRAQKVLRESLVAARKEAGLTQQELADRLGKPQSFVAKYEGGERRLDVVEFAQVAAEIGCDAVKAFKKVAEAVD